MALTVRTVFDGHVVLDIIKSNYVNISEKDRCPGVDIDFFWHLRTGRLPMDLDFCLGEEGRVVMVSE